MGDHLVIITFRDSGILIDENSEVFESNNSSTHLSLEYTSRPTKYVSLSWNPDLFEPRGMQL